MELEVLGNTNDQLTKEELFKLYLAIDAELANEPVNRGLKGVGQTDELQRTRSVLVDIINAPFDGSIDDVIEVYRNIDDNQGVSGLKDFLKKVGSGIKNTVEKIKESPVVQTVSNVVKKAAEAVHKVVTLPLKGALLLVLNTIGAGAGMGFLYAFIPDGSPILAKNPEVKRKREKQIKALEIIAKFNSFEKAYLMKHVRNAIVKKTGYPPEHHINERVGLAGDGVGEPVSWAAVSAAIVALLPAVPALVGVFGKKDIPDKGDFEAPKKPEDKINVPFDENNPDEGNNDDDNDNEEGNAFVDFIKSPMGIITSVLVLGGIGTGIYLAVREEPKGKRR